MNQSFRPSRKPAWLRRERRLADSNCCSNRYARKQQNPAYGGETDRSALRGDAVRSRPDGGHDIPRPVSTDTPRPTDSNQRSDRQGLCPFCHEPLRNGAEVYTDEDGVTGHAACHDMDRSAAHGDWITWEYE